MSFRHAWIVLFALVLGLTLARGRTTVILAQDETSSSGVPQLHEGPRFGLTNQTEGLHVLVIQSTATAGSVQRALNSLGVSYDLIDSYADVGHDWTLIDFAPYHTVVLGLDGGEIGENSLEKIRTDVIDQGKRALFIGGTQYRFFAEGVDQYLVNNSAGVYFWRISVAPHLTVVESGDPLARFLGRSISFVDQLAAYYMLRATDPSIRIAATNGDGHPALFFKSQGFPPAGTLAAEATGSLIWFLSSPKDEYWQHDTDYRVLEQVIANALAYGWIPGPTEPFDLTRYDCAWFDDGTGSSDYNQKIYCPGGRSAPAEESDVIWRFDPVNSTWQDTGHRVFEDVSNYSANVLCDGNGCALYIVSGYDVDIMANVSLVQRYYPATGMVEVLANDPWPLTVNGEVARPGACQEAQNKLYCFGGFVDTSAPYFSNATWEFDLDRPAGNRWMQVHSANLSMARGHIQHAELDGIVYAMGGVASYVPDPLELDPTDLVEALDVNNLAAGWQPRAAMPIPAGEGRGFAWGSRVYVAGGGDWPGETADVMIYSVSDDSWSLDVPNLITPRRNHAATVVPVCTSNPLDGMPGLWVFGGWIGADNPPFGNPEYFPLPCYTRFLPMTFKNW